MATEHEQLKSMLHRAKIPAVETLPNLTDNLIGVKFGASDGRAVEFYFDLKGNLLNVEIPEGRRKHGH